MLRTLRVLGQDGQQPKGEKPVGLELTCMDGSGVVKALLVKADERTRQFLDQYEEMRPRTIHDTEKDKVALSQAMKIIQQIKDGSLDTSEPEKTPAEEKEDKAREDSTISKLEAETAESEISEEQKEHIARELTFFRERAALKEKEKREQEEKAERQRASQQQREKDAESQAHRSGRERAWGGSGSRHMDFVLSSGSNHNEVGSASNATSSSGAGTTDHDTGADSEAEEKARQERRERELDQSYRERERRWEQREAERMRLYEKDKARDEDYAAEQKTAKEAMAYRYTMWDDDVERERRHEDYYRDRSRWWQRRQAFLQKEERYDSLDREEEKEELEQEAIKVAQEKAVAAVSIPATAVETPPPAAEETPVVDRDGDSEMKDAASITADTVDASLSSSATSTPTQTDPSALLSTILPNQTTKLKLSLSSTTGILKRGSEASSGNGSPAAGVSGASGFVAANEFGQDDEEEKAVKKRRVLVPLKYSDDEDDSQDIVNSHSNGGPSQGEKEKREQEIKALIQSIPSEAQGLWSWPIQWQYVAEDNEVILKEKIQPFASKKVVELLGEEDEELTSFVMEHVRQKKPPQELADDLRKALDDDADILVMKIWRMLIFETESKARKLSSK
ncbi:hypothetical protein BGZ65_007368 [Modicella reniformis]|uniref:PWI domain-containing protein n=1 Tax=Modicella reniformis TaxID=1440133 RepID=A0A9P6LXS2_9FUNG|nr:hypothetical protein BGZ65_007368 [Modicella reniformis]